MKQQASIAAVVPTRHSDHKQISSQVAQAAREKAQKDRAAAYAEVLLQTQKKKERAKKATKIETPELTACVCVFSLVMTLFLIWKQMCLILIEPIGAYALSG